MESHSGASTDLLQWLGVQDQIYWPALWGHWMHLSIWKWEIMCCLFFSLSVGCLCLSSLSRVQLISISISSFTHRWHALLSLSFFPRKPSEIYTQAYCSGVLHALLPVKCCLQCRQSPPLCRSVVQLPLEICTVPAVSRGRQEGRVREEKRWRERQKVWREWEMREGARRRRRRWREGMRWEAGVRDGKGSRTKGRVGVVGSEYQRGTSVEGAGEEMRGKVNIGALVSSNLLLFINFTSLIHRFLQRKPSSLAQPPPPLAYLLFSSANPPVSSCLNPFRLFSHPPLQPVTSFAQFPFPSLSPATPFISSLMQH